MSQNGQRPKAVEWTLDSGIRVLITPLSPYTRRLLLQILREQFPDPNPAEFAEPIPGQESPGATIPVTSEQNSRHEEFQRLQLDAQRQRNEAYIHELARRNLHFPDYPNREALIAAYAETIESLRKVIPLPADPFEAVFRHIVIASDNDIRMILDVAHDELDLLEADPSEEEIHQAWRIFRPSVQGQRVKRLLEYTSRLQESQKVRD